MVVKAGLRLILHAAFFGCETCLCIISPFWICFSSVGLGVDLYIEVSILQHWEMPSHFDFRRTLPLSVHVLAIDSDSKIRALKFRKKFAYQALPICYFIGNA